MRLIPALLLGGLVALTAHPVAAQDDDRTMSVVTPKGIAISGATIYDIQESRAIEGDLVLEKSEVRVTTITSGEDGGFLLPKGGDDSLLRILMVEAPGRALGLWNMHRLRRTLVLEDEYFVTGTVVDPKGSGVENATVTISRIGFQRRPDRQFSPAHEALPWFKTTTDQDGTFRFRGIVPNHRDEDAGMEITVRAEIDGVAMVGTQERSSVGAIPFFDNARQDPPRFPEQLVQVAPLSDIGGLVIDALTGAPLQGAKLKVNGVAFDPNRPADVVVTGKDGRFAIKRNRIERVLVTCDGYKDSHLIPPENWASESHPETELKLPLRPATMVTGRCIDAHTGKAPLAPHSLSFKCHEEAGAEWILALYSSAGELGESGLVQPDGSFALELPAGSVKLTLAMVDPYGSRPGPYGRSFDLELPSEGEKDLELTLDRKPGLLVAVRPSKPVGSLKPRSAYWERVSVGAKHANRDSYSPVGTRLLHFMAVDHWGDEVDVQVELARDGHQGREKIVLIEKRYKADPDIWPVLIDAAGLREEFRKQELGNHPGR